MSNEWQPANIYEVLSDDRARQILVATNDAQRSAQDISDICDGSLSSIYRRLDILSEYDLLEKEIRIDQDGHHHSVYEPDFEAIEVQLDDDVIEVTVDRGGETNTHVEEWQSLDF